MAVSLVGSPTTGGGTSTDSRSFSRTITAGTNKALAIFVFYGDAGSTVSSMTVAGNNATYQGNIAGSGAAYGVELWTYTGASAGANTIAYTLNASAEHWHMVVEMDGVDQTTPVRASSLQTAVDASFTTGDTLSVTVGSATGDLVLGGIASNGTSLHTIGADQTTLWDANDSDVKQASYESGAASVTFSYASGSAVSIAASILAASFQQASAGGTAVKDIIGMGIIPFAR